MPQSKASFRQSLSDTSNGTNPDEAAAPNENLPQCCRKNPPAYRITYDCGKGAEQTILVCKYHYQNDKVFSMFVKQKIPLESQDHEKKAGKRPASNATRRAQRKA